MEFEDVSLLGAPLFSGVALDNGVAPHDRCEDLARAVDRLSVTGSQNALILLIIVVQRSNSSPSTTMLSIGRPSFSQQVFTDY